MLLQKIIFSSKIKKKNLITFFFTISIFAQFSQLHSSEISKDNIFYAVNNCIQNKNKQACKQTIVELEKLQLDEASFENYSCQTRLLELQSYLIISMNKLNKKDFDKNILKEVEEICL